MSLEEFVDYVNSKMPPYSVNEHGRAKLAGLYRKYPIDLLLECVDIGIEQYLFYDSNGKVKSKDVEIFLNKLGGIAHIKQQDPIDQIISLYKHYGKKCFDYWDFARAEKYLRDYVNALREAGWSDQNIIKDLENEVKPLFHKCNCWSNWYQTLSSWGKQVLEAAKEQSAKAENQKVETHTPEDTESVPDDRAVWFIQFIVPIVYNLLY